MNIRHFAVSRSLFTIFSNQRPIQNPVKHRRHFSILNPSHLIKVTKCLIKISQFKFLVMMEKKHFFDKLFLSLNILNFRLFFYVKSATSLKKDTPSFPATPLVYFLCKNCKSHLLLSQQPPSINWDPIKPLHPLFKNLVVGSTPPPLPSREGEGCTIWKMKPFAKIVNGV